MHTLVKIAIILASALAGHTAAAQEIRVLSGKDHSPLSYATVTNHSQAMILSANTEGIARLKAVIGDTLSVSYVGYKTSLFRFEGQRQLSISLLPLQRTLPTVTIHSCKNTRESSVANFKEHTKRKDRGRPADSFGGVIWGKESSQARIAVRVDPLKAYATLKEFSFWLEKFAAAPAFSMRTPLLISLYEVDDSSDLPGELISTAPVIYYPRKAGKQTVHFDSLNVSIPAKGIYVSIQYVMNEEYQWDHVTKWKDKEQDSVLRDTVITRYGGIIRGIRSKDSPLVFYNGISGKWFNIPKPQSDALPASIRFAATITYCEQ